jgi:hypothetical protein
VSERNKTLTNHYRKVGNRPIVAADRLNKGRPRPLVNEEPCINTETLISFRSRSDFGLDPSLPPFVFGQLLM